MLLLCLQYYCLLMWREMKRMNWWWMSFVCLLSFVFTTHIEFRECCVWLQCFTQWCCSCPSNLVLCWLEQKRREWFVDGCHLSVFFLLPSQLRSSAVSVVFDFSDSLNDVAPVFPTLLPVVKEMKRMNCEWISLCILSFAFTPQRELNERCVWFQWFTQWCCSNSFDHICC